MLQTWWDTTLSRFGSGRWHQHWTYSHSWFLEMCSCRTRLPFGNQSSQVEVSGSPFLSGCLPESRFAVSLHFRLGSIPWLLPCQRCCHCWRQPEKRVKEFIFSSHISVKSHIFKFYLTSASDSMSSSIGFSIDVVSFQRAAWAVWSIFTDIIEQSGKQVESSIYIL